MDRPQGGPVEPGAPATPSPDWSHVEDGFWRSLQSTYDAEDRMLLDEHKKQRASLQMRLHELYRERNIAAERLRQIDASCSAEEAKMETISTQYEENRKVRFAMRDGTVAKMKTWFANSRMASGGSPPSSSAPHKAMNAMNAVGAISAANALMSRPAPLPSVITNDPTGVEISDSSDQILGPLNMIRTRNPAIDSVLNRRIKRRCKIRSNRKYTPANLTMLYEPTDTKGGKWIACMIQATGEVQPRKCTNCDKAQGPFEECIMLDGEGFSKCGNCEWSRQGCHGSSRDNSSPNAADPDAARSLVYRSIDARGENGMSGPPSVDNDDDEDEMLMITPENLVVKHDGLVYTEPECVRGVPVAKIDKSHPYWDPNWPEVEDIIRPQWEKWQAKQEAASRTGGIAQHAKFQIGRQVNRGKAIIEFLSKGSFSPYQLLAKKYMTTGKGGIISYDTLFRLANTIEELQQFKRPIKPVDWLRHRLHEILLIEGDKFNLSRTMHDFYHDPKLSALRKKCGFSQIGRPSGVRMRASMGSGAPTPPAKRRRGNQESPRNTPPATPGLYRSPFTAANNPYSAQPSPVLTKEASPEEDDTMVDQTDDDDGNVTDTDSYSGDSIEPTDFRIYQIKHRKQASNPQVTQYWHWLDDEGERSFEHQVLKDINPTQWGIYKPPINFNVNFQDMVEVLWAPSSQRIVVRMRATIVETDGEPRGDVLVHFKRDRTLRRFCKHVAKKGVRVTQTSIEDVEDRWDKMQSEVLPNKEDDDMIEV